MAATLQQHRTTNTNTTSRANNTAASPNPQLKHLVYSKYRELLGSYNDQANAYLDTLPSYMVHKDTGFNLDAERMGFPSAAQPNGHTINNNQNEMYGAGQRMPAQQNYEAPACVQNAMMTKDKKPFTYTPGGIDLSQIKSERMAKRLARNAQAEGATGIQQQNRPTQPQSPGGSSPGAAATMGAAAMGMPFQVLPPPPPPPAPGTLAPPSNGNGAGGRGSAPNSPSMPRKSPTPQRFEPPPMGFRPEIKIPPNPMAALRKVPPPVEKNTFWKDEYVKERSKSPMVDLPNNANSDSVNSPSSSPQTTIANYNGTAVMSNDNTDGLKKAMPTANAINQTNNPESQQQNHTHTPPTPSTPANSQQAPLKPIQNAPQYGGSQSPLVATQQAQVSKPEFRSVATPTTPAVNVYTRQTDSPRSVENATPVRSIESPLKFAQQQQHQQRAPTAVSPFAQQCTPSSASTATSVSPNNQAQSVPWRSQRAQSQQPHPSPLGAQSHPQPIYNNVQQQQHPQQQSQRTPEFSSQQSTYQGPKPTNVGSLYIAPLAAPIEPQAQNIVRQQMQQQQRDSPMRQTGPQQQHANQHLRWMSSQPMAKEQPAWARPEENGNVVPSSLHRIRSPPPSSQSAPPPAAAAAPPQPQTQHVYEPLHQGNGFATHTVAHNFGAHPVNATGLRLQISAPVNQSNSQNGPKERIIPIQLEHTPTNTPVQPSEQHAAGSIPPAPGYVMRTPNQFVDQGYNNFGHHQQQQHQQQQQSQPQRVMSPTVQQLNAPRMVQQTQTQNNVVTTNKTHIIPISIEGNEGTRGPISKTPIVIQNDQRTPPVQSKSFRILQKITDTIDDSSNDDKINQQQQHIQQPIEPQLQRPTFARQMSAQQARHSPTVEQMRRMQIGHEQGNYSAPSTPSAIQYYKQQPLYDNSQHYIPASEQQVAEPKKYTGSAIPSRSFKILQAMTQPENADMQENCQKNNEMNEIESKPESNRPSSCSCNSSAVQSASSSSSVSINSDLDFSSSSSSTPMHSQSLPYPLYQYPYAYPWYPSPHLIASNQKGNHCATPPPNWQYTYGMSSNMPTASAAGEHSVPYLPYPYYYPCYPPLPPPLLPSHSAPHSQGHALPPDLDLQNLYSYMPQPPHPYIGYPYPIAPSHSEGSNSSNASSVLPDIIVTPSTEDAPSKIIMNHHIKDEQERSKHAGPLELDVTPNQPNTVVDGSSVLDILSHQLESMTKCIKNNLNTSNQSKKSYTKNLDQKSPEDNTSPVQITMLMTASEKDSETETETSDSDLTPKVADRQEAIPLKSIKSVNNVQIYNGVNMQQVEADFTSDSESEDTDGPDDDNDDNDNDETTADGESEIFDDEDENERAENEKHYDYELQEEDFESEEFIVDDGLSVIYEEESEMEKSSGLHKNVAHAEKLNDELRLEKKNTLNDLNDNERDDSTSVTVRLPLKFSFSTTKDAESITTLEVGKSHIEQTRNSISLSENHANSFNVATVQSDSEESDNCDISVTVSLTNSSRSSSMDAKVINNNASHVCPIKDIPTQEETVESFESSLEDVSVSFSLNMRNKFANETNNGDVTNNIANIKDARGKEIIANSAEQPEEIDFFATLMATKEQAQKIKEQSASYWGNSTDEKSLTAASHRSEIKVEENMQNNEKYSKKGTAVKAKPKDFQETRGSKESQSNSCDESKEFIKSSLNYTNIKETEMCSDTSDSGEIEDIWADRKEDLPPIRPIKNKLSSMEMGRNPLWSSVYESDAETEKIQEKPLLQAETVTTVEMNANVLKLSITETPQPQTGCMQHEEETVEPIVPPEEEPEEVDFWAQIENTRGHITPEPPEINDSLPMKTHREGETTTIETTLIDSFGEQETSMYDNDVVPRDLQEFDALKYPEEPREVDTDEEIDFWTAIEANRQAEEDDVTFHKSATFWASRERYNSVDETPYKPVLPKAFHAKLPDELPTENFDIWETLKAHRGEEPLIIDPEVEQENLLAQEYDDMMKQKSDEEKGFNDDKISVHEPIVASVWCPQAPQAVDFAAQEPIQNINDEAFVPKPELDDVEVKRSNYRKAMAFFTTSIDENKEPTVDRYERSNIKSTRTSYIEDETENWDWDAINEELQQTSETAVQTLPNKQAFSSNKNNKEATPLPEPCIEPSTKRASTNGLPDLEMDKLYLEKKISVKERISAFELGSLEKPNTESRRSSINKQSLSVEGGTRQSSLSRNSSTQRSESEMDEDDSGVTDMNKQLSETDTESESFPELRKMSSYQRASTHSRLFKLLQDDPDVADSNPNADEFQFKPSRKKIIHNVSITRKQNPSALAEAETMSQRRERLSLPLCKNTSIDNDNPSTPNSPASPIMGHTANKSSVVSDKLVSELVQSLLLRSDSTHFKNLPMEKLQAAAKRVLEEELDSLENTSVDSTPAATPGGNKKDKTYADYYNTWSDALGNEDIIPSKSFRALQDSRRSPWTARCPRVLSSKTINRDLARVTESPEISMHNCKSSESFRQTRETSIGKWKK